MRRYRERTPAIEVLLVVLADVPSSRAFFDQHWPQARVVADPQAALYEAFGVGKGRLGALIGPRVWPAALRAARQGHAVGRPVGDVTWLSAQLLVQRGVVLWAHRARHAGERSALDQVPDVAPLACGLC